MLTHAMTKVLRAVMIAVACTVAAIAAILLVRERDDALRERDATLTSLRGALKKAAAATGTCAKSWMLHDEKRCREKLHVGTANAFNAVYDGGVWQDNSTAQALKKMGPQFYYYASHKMVDGRPYITFRNSLSGTGSNKGVASYRSLHFLAKTVTQHGVTSVLDVPCGDANWQFDTFATDSLPVFLGMDIVKSVIDMNNKRFCHHGNKRFIQWDIASCGIPTWSTALTEVAFELVHMRDVIQHFLLEQGCAALQNVATSGVRHVTAPLMDTARVLLVHQKILSVALICLAVSCSQVIVQCHSS